MRRLRMTAPSPAEEQPPKKKSLLDLLPEKAPVTSSLGTLYVRHATMTDLGELEGEQDLGAAALKRFVSRIQDKRDKSGLSEDDVRALTEADIAQLVPAVVKRSNWDPIQGPPNIKSLDEAVRAGLDAHKRQFTDFVTSIREKVGSSYGFLNKDALERFKDDVSGLAAIRTGLPSAQLEAALKAAESPAEMLRRTVGASTSSRSDPWADVTSTPRVSIEALRVPRPEETPVGRAAIENAEQTRLLAAKMDALTSIMAGMQQTLVTDVLPAWMRKVEDDQRQAKSAFKQAAIALVASVLATLGTAAWQVHVAENIDKGTSGQQERAEALLKQQLKAQQELLEQQARQGEELRRALNELQQRAVAKPAKSGSATK